MNKLDEARVRWLSVQPDMSKRRMARETGVSIMTVVRYMKKMNIDLKYRCKTSATGNHVVRPVTQLDPAVLQRMLQTDGITLAIMSRSLNVHHMSIKSQLKKYGLSLPSREQIAVESLLRLGE